MKDSLTINSINEAGAHLLHDAFFNRETAFSEEERKKYGLEGLLPVVVETIEDQLARVNLHLKVKPNDLERYIYLTSLRDRNQTLFFKVLMSDPARFIPIMYDPTVAEACIKFSHIYRESSGMYLSLQDKGNIRQVLSNWPVKDVRFICVSTGGRILGLGDLGANGMGIPIGKLQLYTACAAVPPEGLLPLLLDCGTDNNQLLEDPLYIGLRKKRPSTEELDEFVDEFVNAVQEVFPNCCIHFEDWKGTDALRLLARYKDKISCYNDDIQGTAAVSLAGIIGALNITGEKLSDQKILFFGAGSAGIGIANMISVAMQLEGLTREEANERISMFDINGLLESTRTDLIKDQLPYTHHGISTHDLVAAITEFRPSILIGVSTVGKSFTKDVVEKMTEINKRPIIFALSNPTENSECTAEEAYTWSKGMAIFAAGVPFEPVKIDGETYYSGQANNFYCFPGVSLGIFAAKPKIITDKLWIECAHALADLLTPSQKKMGMIYPPQSDILSISTQVAVRVAESAFKDGLAQVDHPGDVKAWIKSMQYKAEYPLIPEV